VTRHKLRNVRARQWERYISRLIGLSHETLAPPAYNRFYNYGVTRYNRAQTRREMTDGHS
jgi:hypothetical protein